MAQERGDAVQKWSGNRSVTGSAPSGTPRSAKAGWMCQLLLQNAALGGAHSKEAAPASDLHDRPRRMLANRKHLAGYGVDGDGLCLELHHVDRRAVLRLQLDRDHIAETEALRSLLRQLYRLLG